MADGNLPAPQQELAHKRARAVRDHIETQLDVDVGTYNMAKRTGLLGRMFGGQEGRVKGKDSAGEDRVAQAIHQHGKPSSVVVVVTRHK